MGSLEGGKIGTEAPGPAQQNGEAVGRQPEPHGTWFSAHTAPRDFIATPHLVCGLGLFRATLCCDRQGQGQGFPYSAQETTTD